MIYVPVKNETRIIGVLSIQSYSPNAYTQADLNNMQALADHCGGALERVWAEAALQEANDRLRLALAAGKMGTWTTSLTGAREVTLSPELEAILGLHSGEFARTEDALFEFVDSEDREAVRQAFSGAIENNGDFEVEFRFQPRDRPQGWLLGRGRAYYDDDGKPVRLAGVAIDISARKEVEQMIGNLNFELERRVRERTAELESINQELEAFAYSVSHDLRAPLRSIRGFSEALIERYGEKFDNLGKEFLRRICDSSGQMDRLIEDLLKLSRASLGELSRQSVDLSAVAESVVRDLREAEAGRKVEVMIEPDLRADGDERLLGVVVENLLRNAWKFTGTRLDAKMEFGFTTIPEPAFFVRDNGAGFDMAYADKLFGVFQRLHSVKEFPGTGVGLATVQRIIKRHHGRVWATGVVNGGATFYFTLPNDPALNETSAPGFDR
jgi:PAS domain S-box-containing protein